MLSASLNQTFPIPYSYCCAYIHKHTVLTHTSAIWAVCKSEFLLFVGYQCEGKDAVALHLPSGPLKTCSGLDGRKAGRKCFI